MKKENWFQVPMSDIGAEMIRIATKRKHSAEQALNDFLDYGIKTFDISKVREHKTYEDWMKSILQEDEEYNHILMRWMQDTNKALNSGTFCDFFGATYESTFQGKGKATRMGQFFTPPNICSLLAGVINNVDYDEKIIKVSDCCCGSGRLLLGFLATQTKEHFKKHRYVFLGEDLDPVSCKMSALNLMAHCCYGAVIHHDVLLNDTPNLVYLINECQVPYPNPVMCVHTLIGKEAEDWWLNGGVGKLPLYYGKEWQGCYSDEENPTLRETDFLKIEEKPKIEEQTTSIGKDWVQLSLFCLR